MSRFGSLALLLCAGLVACGGRSVGWSEDVGASDGDDDDDDSAAFGGSGGSGGTKGQGSAGRSTAGKPSGAGAANVAGAPAEPWMVAERLMTCGVNQMRIEGSLDGIAVSLAGRLSNFSFTNKLSESSPGKLVVSSGQGKLLLEFNKSLPFDGDSPARGSLVDSDGALSAGNCETGAFPSAVAMSSDGNTYYFTLRALHREPYCKGAAIRGSLSGCMHPGN